MQSHRFPLLIPFSALLLLAGCGSDDHASNAPAAAKSSPLAKPLYATCGTKNFRRVVLREGQGESAGWRVMYTRSSTFDLKGRAVKVPGPPASIMLLERAPTADRGSMKGGTDRTIGNRSVSFAVLRAAKEHEQEAGKTFGARWLTEKALYIALSAGASEKTLSKLISCMP